jgi:ribosomal protein L10
MISKERKAQLIEEGKRELDQSRFLLFADFGGSGVGELVALRRLLKSSGAKFKVIKKRLLKIIFQEKGVAFDPLKFEGQVGVVFGQGNIEETIQPLYQFAKEHQSFKFLGGFDLETKSEIPLETIMTIGSLPSREAVVAQLIGVLSSPIRALLYGLEILSQRSKGA